MRFSAILEHGVRMYSVITGQIITCANTKSYTLNKQLDYT